MERLQHNGGTAGLVAAALLALGFILFMTTGLDPQSAMNPEKALPFIAQQGGRWAMANIAFALTAALSVLFVAGLASRLREKAPTRSAALLYFAIIGLASYALTSLVQWHGGGQVARYMAADQVAANHAWVAVAAVARGLDSLGNGFVGAAEVITGWAITATGVLPAGVGWLALATGVVTFLQLFIGAPWLFFVGIILTVLWLAWTGNELRRA
jgi:hypothetical protein